MAKQAAYIDNQDLKKLLTKFSNIEGFDKYVDSNMSKAVKEAENAATVSFRDTFNQRTGEGRASITSGKDGKNRHYVKAGKNYMAYLEFGTIEKVDLKPLDDLGIDRNFAIQWKGKGKRTRGGIKAGHYFFPNVKKAYDKMLERIERDLKKILKK